MLQRENDSNRPLEQEALRLTRRQMTSHYMIFSMVIPKSVAPHAKIASRAAVLRPGEGSEECWGRHTVSLSHSASLCFSFSPARAPPRKQGHTETVTVAVLVRPDDTSLRTRGT